MFFNEATGFWTTETFKACSGKVGDVMLINCGGPWSSTKVEIVKIEELKQDRCKVYAKEVK